MENSERKRTDRVKWPEQTREHYIRLFSLQERLRVHLKMAQELAKRNYYLKYDTNPRKTNPLRIAGRQDDYLRKYREDQWPDIKLYLKYMGDEIRTIKSAYKGGRPPKWYEQISMVETLTEQILEKMELIQVQLIVTLRSNGLSIKESNKAIIEETAKALILARDLREVLLFVPLDRAKIGVDEFGFEAILENLTEPFIMDLTTLWQQSRAKNKRG